MRTIALIAHDIRSCHNVGSLLRTAEGLGVDCVYLGGYTPYPHTNNDTRLPHISRKITNQISKTALGAETTQTWEHYTDITTLICDLRLRGFTIAGLEQTPDSIPLHTYAAPSAIAVIVGREVEGIEQTILDQLDTCLEIPMFGQKESFNVVQASAMVLYQLRFGQTSE